VQAEGVELRWGERLECGLHLRIGSLRILADEERDVLLGIQPGLRSRFLEQLQGLLAFLALVGALNEGDEIHAVLPFEGELLTERLPVFGGHEGELVTHCLALSFEEAHRPPGESQPGQGVGRDLLIFHVQNARDERHARCGQHAQHLEGSLAASYGVGFRSLLMHDLVGLCPRGVAIQHGLKEALHAHDRLLLARREVGAAAHLLQLLDPRGRVAHAVRDTPVVDRHEPLALGLVEHGLDLALNALGMCA